MMMKHEDWSWHMFSTNLGIILQIITLCYMWTHGIELPCQQSTIVGQDCTTLGYYCLWNMTLLSYTNLKKHI